MSRYKIWDKNEPIYTPSGEEFTKEQWLARYKWANNPSAKMIIGAGVINGTVAMEFNATVEYYKKRGCVIDTATMTDEQVLQAIEDFEDNPPAAEPDVTERMVALEEYKAMVETEGYQAPKEIIAKNYKRGLWTSAMVDMAVTKGSITTAEKAAIIEPVVVEPIIKEITK
jgi:hypothetical protein